MGFIPLFLHRFFRSPMPDPDIIASDLPKIFWIELTSTCSFNCIFCSRSLKRGKGQHMSFDLYRRFISQLHEPEILRLNYAGESIHYPHLFEAIELAAATGARTELVSAFADIPDDAAQNLAESRLNNLTISLHTFDERQYNRIYRHAGLKALKHKIDIFLEHRQRQVTAGPKLSIAFVCMRHNLFQLPFVAEFADRLQVSDLFVQPVHIRDPLPEPFEDELPDHPKHTAFKDDIRQAVEEIRSRYPHLNIAQVCMETPGPWMLDQVPKNFPPPLPEGCRIHSCEQNPWDTAHVLSNGDVVACEVMDDQPLGNLNDQSLAEIWHGQTYRRFRRDYVNARMEPCRECPFKWAFRPGRITDSIVASGGLNSQLLRGWYDNDDGDIIWSKKESVAILKRRSHQRRFRIQGVLPGCTENQIRQLHIECEKTLLGSITGNRSEFMSFDELFDLKRLKTVLNFRFTVEPAFHPAEHGNERDIRVLGFALIRMALE